MIDELDLYKEIEEVLVGMENTNDRVQQGLNGNELISVVPPESMSLVVNDWNITRARLKSILKKYEPKK